MQAVSSSHLTKGTIASMDFSEDVDRERLLAVAPHPNRTGGSPASGFPVHGLDGLAQALDSGLRKGRTSRAGTWPRSPVSQAVHCPFAVASQARGSGAAERTALRHSSAPCENVVEHPVPVPLRSTVVTRFPATPRTLTPTGPLAPSRGSLTHVTRASKHSISNHLRCSTRRVPLPQRWPLDFVRASPFRSQARQNRRPNRVHLSRCIETCYGLFVHFQLLSTRGCRPGAVTFSYWPYSVGQVGDSHPAVQVRSQAHERRLAAGLPLVPGETNTRDKVGCFTPCAPLGKRGVSCVAHGVTRLTCASKDVSKPLCCNSQSFPSNDVGQTTFTRELRRRLDAKPATAPRRCLKNAA